ncbi:MAG: GIY-YIG nuclease family protein [Desulfobacter sp.]
MSDRLPSAPGTYALILRNPGRKTFCVGRLGPVTLPRGWYVYTGSAFGPGGLAARVGRHLRPDKSKRWHVDYLTSELPVSRIWYTTWRVKQECAWAGFLSAMGGKVHIPGFGASDCNCSAHLFSFPRLPGLTAFRTLCRPTYPVPVIRLPKRR